MRSKHLDSDGSVEPSIPCAIHFTHASSTQRRLDFVRAEFRARGEGHVCAQFYSLCGTLHVDATIMGEWSLALPWDYFPTCPSFGTNCRCSLQPAPRARFHHFTGSYLQGACQ